MTPDEINRRLAVECMGWELKELTDYGWCYFDERGSIHCPLYWNPYHSITDAMRVVEKINKEFKLERDRSGKWFGYVDDDRWYTSGNEDTPSAAICLAALEWVESKRKEAGDADA